MKKGKAQVAIFVIIAVLVAGGAIVLIAVNSDSNLFGLGVDEEAREVYDLLNSCVKQRTIDAVRLIGLQGGYISPEEYIESNLGNIAYGLKNKRNVLASNSDIEREIANYVEFALPFCISGNLNYEVVSREPEVSITIKKNSVRVIAEMPVSVTKGESSFEIKEKYDHEIQIRLGKSLEVANLIIKEQIKEGEYVPITTLMEFEQDVLFTNYDEDTLIYVITDQDSRIDGIPYSFEFVVNVK